MRLAEQLEGLAAEILAETEVPQPVSAFVLADAVYLKLTPVGAYEEGIVGNEVRFNTRLKAREQHESVFRYASRYLLERTGHYATDHAVVRLARALALPRDRFLADVQRGQTFGWLMAQYPYASDAMIGARVGELATQQQRRARGAHALTR